MTEAQAAFHDWWRKVNVSYDISMAPSMHVAFAAGVKWASAQENPNPRTFTSSEHGRLTITINEAGECELVSYQNTAHEIIKIIWEKK